MATPLAHRFSESAFRKYEKIISLIAEKYPEAVVIDPAHMGLSPETIRGRLRDACRSFLTNKWESKLDFAKFSAIPQDLLVISIREDGKVIAGTKESVKSDAEPALDIVSDIDAFDITPYLHRPQVELLLVLAHFGCLKKQLRLPLALSDAMKYYETFDVAFTPTNDPNTCILL